MSTAAAKHKKKAYILNQKIDREFNAAGKAMQDVFKVFTDNGVKVMPGAPKNAHKLLKLIDFPILVFFLIFVLGAGDYCIFSYPENVHKIRLLKKLAPIRRVKTVCFINDINSIREGNFDDPRVAANIKKDMDIINCAKIIMAPNKNSKEFLREHGVTGKILTVGTWDYIMENTPVVHGNCDAQHISIAFAGNLNKAPFIEKLGELDCRGVDIVFNVWGGYDGNVPENEHLIYRGSVSPDALAYETAKCDFGLVWDGVGIHECSGGLGEYLRYNNSHKCGLYLASGIPVFVWKHSGLADFVGKNACGFLIEGLDEIPDILMQMTAGEYAELKEKVSIVSENVRSGYYLKRVLDQMFES